MEENILLPENPLPPGEVKLVSDPSSHMIEPSPSLTDLRPVQISLNGLPETKSNMFDKMDIDNHNVTVDSTTDSEIHKSDSSIHNSDSEHLKISVPNSISIETVSEHIVITEMDLVPSDSISGHHETTDTNCLRNNSISQHLEIADISSVPCESASEQIETANGSSVSNESISECLAKTTKKSLSDSPQVTPGKSRYGRVRRPKLSVDFVSVDKKSFAVLNSSSYDFVHAEASRLSKTPVVKKKRSYIRKSNVFPKDNLQKETPNNTTQKLEEPQKSSKTENGGSTNEFSITNSDICSIDESSISSLNSSIVKTYSRLSETGGSSDDRLSGTEESSCKELIPINYTELNWKVGDVAWAKVGCYPYWPSIVTLEYGSSIYAKSVGKRGNRLAVHVQFFGDRGRRSWVLTTSLIKYESKEQFMKLKRLYSKDKLRMKYFNIIRSKDLWEKAILEADTILKLPHEERIQYYHNIYPVSEETYVAEMVTNKMKRSPIRKRRKNPLERRGRKRKILVDSDNCGRVKKKTRLENVTSNSASQRNATLMRRGRGRPPKKLAYSMEEHLRKRRAFEKRLKKIMNQSNDEKAKTKAVKKLQNSVNKFDQLVQNEKLDVSGGEKLGESGEMKRDEPTKKNALSVYDFESDEETDVFLGTYNSRYTPHLLAKIEEKKSDEVENTEAPSINAEASTAERESSDKGESDDKKCKKQDDVETEIESDTVKDASVTDASVEVKPKRGRGRPKGSKNVKTLLKLQQKRGRGRPRLIKNMTQEKLSLRQKRKAILLKSEQKLLKKQSSETNDGNDSTSEQRKKVHPKKRLLEKSRRSEKISKTLSIENVEDNEKSLADENVKLCKRSPSMSSKEDLDSDDEDLKTIRPDTDGPQLPAYKSKKNSALFSGFKFEKVCLICEKAGDTVRCRGPCSGTYHIECAVPTGKVEEKRMENAENGVSVVPCKRRRSRLPRASSVNLVSANASEVVKNAVPSSASSDESQSDAAADQSMLEDIDNENYSLVISAEDNVTKMTAETNTSEVNASGVTTNDDTSRTSQESVGAENTRGEETGMPNCEKAKATAKSAVTSVPSLDIQKIKDDDRSMISKTLVPPINGHCESLGDGPMEQVDMDSVKDAAKCGSIEGTTEIRDAESEITNELKGLAAQYQNKETEESCLVEKAANCSLELNAYPSENNEARSSDKNDHTVDDAVSSNEIANEQVNKQSMHDSVAADHFAEDRPDSSCMNDDAVGECSENIRIEENKNSNVEESNVEEPSSSTTNANDEVEEKVKSRHYRVEIENNSSDTNSSRQADEPDSCSDSTNVQLTENSEISNASGETPVEGKTVCDVVKNEESAVPVSVLESEEAGSSDACSENLSCSTKTDGLNGIDFRCALCSENKLYPCFTCGQDVEEKTGETERYCCQSASCGRVYHKECLKAWPQATWKGNISGRLIRNGSSVSRNSVIPKETLLCPQHYCHTCISENPAVHKNRHCNEILVRCVRCPTAYHRRVHCIPAGTEILTMSQIICPRHYEPPAGAKSTVHSNTSWCFICCIGGSLICCDECPTSFHAECLQLRPEEYEGRYICDDCQSGRHLLYGDIAWVKLGHYRWWPARILYPNEVPENIQQLPHGRGEFVVQFYGSHDYNWINRGRAFLYQEGDSGKKSCGKSAVNQSFVKAIEEAEGAFEKLKKVKAARDEEARLGWKPPKYVHIKANKPVGNVRIVELNSSNITACECDPQSERPCGPDSDCINRMLLVECNPLVCPAGDRCHNQMFEKRIYPPLMPYNTDKRGWGLKTLVDMKKGDFIIEYVGEMIDEEEYKRRVNIMHKNQEDNYYFLTIDKDRMLDAGPKGNVARFMNHSCDPNCETQKWTVNGDTRVGLFALKDIAANTELVFNYNLSTQGNEMKSCLCGSEKCSGFIGVKAVKNGGSSVEDELRKRSNEENEGELPIKKRGRGRPRKAIRKGVSSSSSSSSSSIPPNEKPSADVPEEAQRRSLKTRRRKMASKQMMSRFNKWSVKDSRFKSKLLRGRLGGGAKKNVESLLKHRELLKQRTMATCDNERPAKERRSEPRGRKKRPKNEEEKQAMLFEMMRKRIQRKIEEMTLCKLDEKCFVCGDSQDDDELLFCDNNKCPKGYHLQCVNLAKWPSGRWLCPWHYCTICRSIRKVLKCDRCTNSYCFLHITGNLSQGNNGRYFCKQHQSSDFEAVSSATMPKADEQLVIEMPDAVKLMSESSSADTPPVAKRPRGRPKGSTSRHRVTLSCASNNATVESTSKSSATKTDQTNDGVIAKPDNKIRKKILRKRRRYVDVSKPSPTEEPARKKFKKRIKTTTPNADVSDESASKKAAGSGKQTMEANVESNVLSGGDGVGNQSLEQLTDIEEKDGGLDAAEITMTSTPTKSVAQDSDESFSSYVASEVVIVDEVAENSTKEMSELSESAGTASANETAGDAETSDDEYDNLEVEVINGEDSN